MRPTHEDPRVQFKLSSICERVLDLLLLEECVASPKFLSWFVGELGYKGRTRLITAAQSVPTANGESDLVVKVQLNKRQLVVLIEDKIDAVLQPRQAARYAERAAGYRSSGACDIATTVLVAPLHYVVPADFEHVVRYESILEWFQGQPSQGPRMMYKQEVLKKAMVKPPRRGPTDPDATAFCAQYWELASDIAPELEMPDPHERPKDSSWLYFKPSALPDNLEMIHKAGYGHVDLTFIGMGSRMAEIHERYGQDLEPGMHITRGGKSAIVRIVVTRINVQEPFRKHARAVRDGIVAAQTLLKWYSRRGAAGS